MLSTELPFWAIFTSQFCWYSAQNPEILRVRFSKTSKKFFQESEFFCHNSTSPDNAECLNNVLCRFLRAKFRSMGGIRFKYYGTDAEDRLNVFQWWKIFPHITPSFKIMLSTEIGFDSHFYWPILLIYIVQPSKLAWPFPKVRKNVFLG